MREVSQVINGKRVIVKKPELLAPAGNLEKLKVAILYGADAVFIGGKEFSLRSSASNFSLEDIQEAVEFAHTHHAAIHVTCNIILHEDNLKGLEEYLLKLDEKELFKLAECLGRGIAGLEEMCCIPILMAMICSYLETSDGNIDYPQSKLKSYACGKCLATS